MDRDGMGWQVDHCLLVHFTGLKLTRVKNKKEMEDGNGICAIGLSPSSFINGGWRELMNGSLRKLNESIMSIQFSSDLPLMLANSIE